MYCVVLRLRTQGRLDIHGANLAFVVAGRSVTVSAPDIAVGFPDHYWISVRASGFESEIQAIEFGTLLREACQVSSVLHRLGVDTGTESPSTPGFFLGGQKQAHDGTRVIRGVYHGLDVYFETSEMQFISNICEGLYVAPQAAPFLAGIKRHFDLNASPVLVGSNGEAVLRLFNEALLHKEPTSRIVLLVSIVEMLGQDQVWSRNQKSALKELASQARMSKLGSAAEMEEVAVSIERLHRLSLRQGVLRLLDRTGQAHLSKAWDRLYEERSELVHAKKPDQHGNYVALAERATRLCGRILISALETSLSPLPEDLETWYPLGDMA